jgi:SH3-like domain-containing protein
VRDGHLAILLYQMAETRQSVDGGALRRTRKFPDCMSIPGAKKSRGRWRRSLRPTACALAALAVAALAIEPATAASDQNEGSGLPVPRFVSLKSDHVNVRGGPDKDHDVAWVYTRPGLPVEITAEYENWRRIRDQDGSEGWVYHSLLSGRRTAFVAKPKAPKELVPLYEQADPESPLRARLEQGVLGAVKRCSGHWCRFVGQGFDGWIEQDRLWGVYPNEKIE